MYFSIRGINLHGGIEKIDSTISIPETWSHFSQNNVQASQGARAQSQRLRSTVDDLLNTEHNSIQQNWTDTNRALQQRIAETISAHTNLKSHLSRTMQEIFDQEKHMDHLSASIRSMGPPLKVAQTRLALRTSRPEIEACRDAPHHRLAGSSLDNFRPSSFSRLVGEVGEIQESIGLLNDKMREAQTVHQDLLRNKSRLEHDIAVKSNSLSIDRQRCLAQRKNLPFRLMK